MRKEDGNLLTDQNEIVNETMRFYKKLYTKRNNTEMDLNNMFLENDIPKLTEKEKILLEGPIRIDETLFSLKKSSNNTSPGCGGFTYEFFKFFWRDLGVYLLAYLSRRLIGELLVYRGIRRPSVRRPSVVNIFKRLLL